MGSCISKSKSPTYEEDDPEPIHIQDKRVIITSSQTPPSPLSNCIPSSPPPPPQIPKCVSSPPFSTPTTSSISSLSSSSSCTSCASSKDRSFSNEFLWSCIKENPHILQEESKKPSPRKAVQSNSSPVAALQRPRRSSLRPSSCSPKQSSRRRVAPQSPTRARSNSPPLALQRSFRKEPDRPGSTPLPRRNLGSSPTLSRRFGKDSSQTHLKNGKAAGTENQTRTKKENQPPASPSRLIKKETTGSNRKAQVDQADLIKKQTSLHHMNQQNRRGRACDQEIKRHPLEDIDNPLIALDCFIFL
ncbi:proline-rich receptor-like protein kinase PERK9 [Aristolochia californica]|uniref:proline-rich receptor-like protein kinase PERK9 n=1 Tax=Aristolochia californica TaxID=171875 RepID=UPI0035DF0FE5